MNEYDFYNPLRYERWIVILFSFRDNGHRFKNVKLFCEVSHGITDFVKTR